MITGVVSIYHAAGFAGVVSSAIISDRFGRRVAFLWAAGLDLSRNRD